MESRAFYGNVLFSTGPNTDMGGKRDTKGHIDMPMCDCTVLLDGAPACACLTPIAQCDGRDVTTVEGLTGAIADRLRTSFLRHG